MERVRIKTADGWDERSMDGEELLGWFREHTKDGAVTDEITLYGEASFEKSGDGGINWVMSTMDLDRDLERVDPTGADFKNFKKNPVVLWSHDHSIPAIGKVMDPKVRDGVVKGNVVFDENDEFAAMIAKKVRDGFVSAGSIGFKPNKVEFVEEPKDATRLVHRKWELVEFSICNVPSNMNALAQRGEDDADEEKADDSTDLVAKVRELEGRIQALAEKIEQKVAEPKTYLDVLFEERGETSTANGSKAVSVLFDGGEPNPQTSAGVFGLMNGGKGNG